MLSDPTISLTCIANNARHSSAHFVGYPAFDPPFAITSSLSSTRPQTTHRLSLIKLSHTLLPCSLVASITRTCLVLGAVLAAWRCGASGPRNLSNACIGAVTARVVAVDRGPVSTMIKEELGRVTSTESRKTRSVMAIYSFVTVTAALLMQCESSLTASSQTYICTSGQLALRLSSLYILHVSTSILCLLDLSTALCIGGHRGITDQG